jgi:Trypsin
VSLIRRAAALALIAALAVTSPASAVRFGEPDNGEHDYVGELLFYVPDAPHPLFTDPGSWFTCSGTLVSPTVVVTAGHCTFAVGLNGESTTDEGEATTTAEGGSGGNDIWINFSEEPDFDGFPPSSDYEPDENQQRYEDRADWLNDHPDWIRGTAYPHPLYDDNQFFAHDMGVVVLDEAVQTSTVGEVPTVGWLDQYGPRSHRDQTFEIVGYGLTRSNPVKAEGGDTRLKGLLFLITLNASPPDSYAVFSNTPSNRARGGLCFGDSGGPVFDNTNSNLIVAVNSWVLTTSCGGQSGGYRLDQPDDLAFLATFGIVP